MNQDSSLKDLVMQSLEKVNAQDIVCISTRHLTSLFDEVIVASAQSSRQGKALAQHLQADVKQAGGQILGVEGVETGEWVLVDLGEMVVHIMQPQIREYYRLEELWQAPG